MKLTRRDFLKTAGATAAALAFPAIPAIAKPRRLPFNPNVDTTKIDQYLDLISLPRKTLLYDDISKVDCAPRYETCDSRDVPHGAPRHSTCIEERGTRYLTIGCTKDEIDVPITIQEILCEGTELEIAQKIADKEEQILLQLLHGGNHAYVANFATPTYFNSLFRLIEQHDCLVHSIILSKPAFEQLTQAGPDFIDVLDDKPLRRVKAHLWTADIYVSEFITDETVYVITQPDKLGVYPLQRHAYVKDGKVRIHAGYSLINPYLCVVGHAGCWNTKPKRTRRPKVGDTCLAGGPGAG